MTDADRSNRAWALVFARLVLGLIFFMAGVWEISFLVDGGKTAQ